MFVSLLSLPSNFYVQPSSTRIAMDPNDLLPPPAYSEQEFDQKVSQATTLSINTAPPASSINIDSDGWPQYDPVAFATPTSEGSSTSPTTVERSSALPMEISLGNSKKDNYMQHNVIDDLPAVVPLRIEKKNLQRSLAMPPAISQPSNECSSLTTAENSMAAPIYSEKYNPDNFRSQLHSVQSTSAESSSSTITENPAPAPLYSETSNLDNFRSQTHSVQNTCAGDDVSSMSSTTMPSVHSTQVAPNRNRDTSVPLPPPPPPPPPFETQPPTFPPASNLLAQPLDYDDRYQQHVDSYNVSRGQSLRQSQERTMTRYPPSSNNFQSSYVPRLDFNPSVAYGKAQPAIPLNQPVRNIQYDPHAFYNSAVSAQITSATAGQHGHSSYSSYNSRNSFTPQKQYQQQGLPATYARAGHYSQSYVSQDPLSLERSSPFEMNSPQQSVIQPPPRPPSTYSMSSNYQTFNDASPSPVYYVNHTANVPGNTYYDQQSAENRWSTQ